MSNKKIIVILESLDENDSSGTKTSVALLHSFFNSGFNVTALHFSQKEIKIDGVNCISVKERKVNLLYILSRMQRLLNRWFKIDIGDSVDKVFGFSFGFFNDVKSLAKAVSKYNPESFNMIWTLSKGNSYRPHKALLSLPEWHYKWYAYVHDPYPQQLYPRPYNYVPYGYKQKRMFFKQVTLKAKRVVFPSLLLKEWLQSYYVDLDGKSLIIPHQILDYQFKNIEFPKYFNPQKFNIIHAGNLLDLRNPKPILESFSLFLKNTPHAINNSTMLFLGKTSIFDKYLSKKAKNIPQLFVSDGYVPFEQVYVMQKAASVNVILEAKSEISPFLPGKFPHCVAADKPLLHIGPYYSECKRLLGNEYPYQYDFNEIEKIAKTLGQLYKKWKANHEDLVLNRPDLKYYLSSAYLKEVIEENSRNHMTE